MVLPSAAGEREWCKTLIAEGQAVHFVSEETSSVSLASTLARLASRENGIVLHTHFAYGAAAWAASRLLRMQGRNLKVVWHARSDFSGSMTLTERIKTALKYRCMGGNAHMIAASEHLRQRVIKQGFPAERIQTIPNGIDLERASAATRSRAQVLSDLGICAGEHLILMFGWHPTVKGVDVAIDAVQTLVNRGHPVVLGVVGTERLREFVRTRMNGQRREWLKVLSPMADVANLYQAASVFVSASRSEGMPSAVSEAMANGIPVVLSDIPGVSWAHEIPYTVFFPSGASSALAEAIQKVLAWKPAQRERFTLPSRHHVRTKLQIGKWAEQVMSVYEDIL